MSVVIPILIIIIFIASLIVVMYRNLTKSHKKVKNTWNQIDFQIKRKIDLIPNLIEVSRGHVDKDILESISLSRTNMLMCSNPKELAMLNNNLNDYLSVLFQFGEKSESLNNSNTFKHIKSQFAECNESISKDRLFYNDAVYKYNDDCERFPTCFVAKIFNFKNEEFFKTTSFIDELFN